MRDASQLVESNAPRRSTTMYDGPGSEPGNVNVSIPPLVQWTGVHTPVLIAHPLPCCNNVAVHRARWGSGRQLPAAKPCRSASINTARPDYRPEHMHENSGPHLSIRLKFCFSGAGLFQPEFPGEIPASRDRRDSGAGLCLDARGLDAAFVLFFPENRAAGARSAPSRRPRRRGSFRDRRAQENRQRGRSAAPRRRNEVLCRSAVSRHGRAAVRGQDRDGLIRHTLLFLTWTTRFSTRRPAWVACRVTRPPASDALARRT